MLDGLMSRWVTPCWKAYCRPSATCEIIETASGTGKRPRGKVLGSPCLAFLAGSLSGLTCLIIVLAVGRLGHAALIAYEGFEYEEIGEQLLRKDGGFGFAGPWVPGDGIGSSPLTITEGSLASGELASTGDRLHVASGGGWIGLVRHLSSTIPSRETGTMYMSFLIRPERGSSRTERPIGWGSVGFIGVFDGNAPWAGYNGSRYVMAEFLGRSGSKSSGVTSVLNEEALFVVRADMTPSQDTFTFYVNPVPGEPEPDTGIVKTENMPGLGRIFITAGSGSAFSVDEIRLGETYFDVTPVLEPVTPALQAGDADQDLDFDQLDLVQVQVAAKYLTGLAATWGQGDWNGAPGGEPGHPPAGNGLFDQFDIIAAQQGANYLTGIYAAIQPGGRNADGQTSVGYDANTGDVWVDAPAGTELTSINIDSASGIFTGQPAQNLGGSFDNDADSNIFKATFGDSFGSLSFGAVASHGLPEEFVLNDLSVVGSLAGGGALGDVDLIYVPVPEPATGLITAIAMLCLVGFARQIGRHRN